MERKPGLKVSRRQLAAAVKAQKKASTRVRKANRDVCDAQKRAKNRRKKK